MPEARSRPLLATGNEVEWAEINREKAEYHRRAARALTPAQRIELGQKLSQQAMSLLAVSVRAGHVPRRALDN
jgi:hypothetical protein